MLYSMEGNMYYDAIQAYCRMKGCPEEAPRLAQKIVKETMDSVKSGKPPANPRFIMLKITSGCNSDCSYCAYSKSQAKYREQGVITVADIESIVRQAAEMGVVAMGINGGEPLIRKDFGEIIDIFAQYKVAPILMTNGLWLPRMWDDLGARGLKYVVISFDTMDKETYELHRGAKFEDALEGIRASVKMKEKYTDVIVHVTSVLTRYNASQMVRLIREMSRLGIWVEIGAYQRQPFQKKDDMSMESRKEAEELIRQIIGMKQDGYLVSNSEEYLRHIPDFFIEKKNVPDNYKCFVGDKFLFVDDYLNVKPCSSPKLHVVGNLKATPLKEIWESGRLAGYRERMHRADCGGCWYLCNEFNSMLEEMSC